MFYRKKLNRGRRCIVLRPLFLAIILCMALLKPCIVYADSLETLAVEDEVSETVEEKGFIGGLLDGFKEGVDGIKDWFGSVFGHGADGEEPETPESGAGAEEKESFISKLADGVWQLMTGGVSAEDEEKEPERLGDAMGISPEDYGSFEGLASLDPKEFAKPYEPQNGIGELKDMLSSLYHMLSMFCAVGLVFSCIYAGLQLFVYRNQRTKEEVMNALGAKFLAFILFCSIVTFIRILGIFTTTFI